MHTPKGADAFWHWREEELQRWAYRRPASSGVGQKFQDHVGIACVWDISTAPLRTSQVRQRSSGKAIWSCHSTR